jgi:hypothetical protein
MTPDSTIISAASTVQLIGLALLAIMLLILGYKVATGGAKGFAFALTEIGGLLASLYILARPNDVMGMLLKFVGGVQTVQMPH